MEIAAFIEIAFKVLAPFVFKELIAILRSDLNDHKELPKDVESARVSIEALIDLNKSLKSENEFQRKQLEELRAKIKDIVL
jgi:hypothetical protein